MSAAWRTVRNVSRTRYYLRALAVLLMLAFGASLLSPFLMGTWGYGVGYWSGWLFMVTLAVTVAVGVFYFARWYRSADGSTSADTAPGSHGGPHAERPRPRRPLVRG